MKKFYLFLMAAAASVSVVAQQLPGADFEQSWVNCTPWTSNNNTKTQGTTPSPWNVSNTVGTGSMGATTVGSQIDGYAGKGIKVTNSSILGNVIPGYFTLGSPWSTAVGMTAKNKDGGTFGGVDFTYRPDAISFYYQSTTSTEQPTVVVYSWKGTYQQSSVPGNIVFSGNPTSVTMTDRDRNILGVSTSQGGSVTSQGTCVSVINTRLKAEQSTWKQEVVPFEYSSADKPEKINVIFSAGDYFSSSPAKDNSLSVDEVKLLYYSRLASLKVNGNDVAGFASDKYEYDLSDVEMPAAAAVSYTFLGTSGMQNATVTTEGNVMKISVNNSNSGTGVADVDGAVSHTYVLTFKEKTTENPEPDDKGYGGTVYRGSIKIGEHDLLGGESLTVPDCDVHIVVNETDKSKCKIALPDFYLSEDKDETSLVGDIVVDNVSCTETAGGYKYEGYDPQYLFIDMEVKLTVSGTSDDSGNCNLIIEVGFPDDYGMEPLQVEFNGVRTVAAIDKVEIDNSNYPVEYYNINGVRVNGENLNSGIYIVRQGKDVKKILVK